MSQLSELIVCKSKSIFQTKIIVSSLLPSGGFALLFTGAVAGNVVAGAGFPLLPSAGVVAGLVPLAAAGAAGILGRNQCF